MSNLLLPPLGDGISEVTLARWLKKPGDRVTRNTPVCEIETDKLSMEVVADADGTLAALCVPEGAKAQVGQVIAEWANGVAPGETDVVPATTGDDAATTRRRVSPVVSRMVAKHGLTLAAIPGSGEGGRVTKNDVLEFLKHMPEPTAQPEIAPPAVPAVRFREAAAAHAVQPLSPMRARIAEHMERSVRSSPHVTTLFEVDFVGVAKHRAAHKLAYASEGVALTYLAYVTLATAQALRQHPILNSQWAADGIHLMRDVNIGIAVSLPEAGLIVPVIAHADELNLKGVARAIQDLAQRARSNGLKPVEMQGGTFSISNHGSGGSLAGTPIINQPQAAILGFGAVEQRVAVINDAIAIRPRAYLSLSFDHRILDGAQADAFMTDIKRIIEKTSCS